MIIGGYFFIDQLQLALTVLKDGGPTLLIYHFSIGAFLKEQILGITLPIIGAAVILK